MEVVRFVAFGVALFGATDSMILPQPWNVLKGEMSLVGLRPPLAGEVAGYALWHTRRLAVKPGVDQRSPARSSRDDARRG